jgi:histidinol-phosphate aminotransferase
MELNANILKNIREVEPYIPGEQPQEKVIKLNTNENPYPPAPGVLKAMRELDDKQLRLYPDPTAANLTEALAEFYHVEKEQVFVGVGSDDVLSMCFLTFFNSDKPILFPDITYAFYKVWAELYQIPYECPKLDKEFCIRKEDYYQENGGVIFPNPNAPTSIYEDLDFVEDVIRHNRDVVVIVDEAYIDFAGKSAVELLDKYPNLLVVQTFSKARSMAGMRIGYVIGNARLIKFLNDVKYSFNSYTMNLPSLVYGTEAVKDVAYFQKTTAKIVETREWAKKEFLKLGFRFPDAKANFIFATHPDYDAKELFEALKKENIYIRYWGSERIEQYLRITIGTKDEMNILFDFLKRYMNK